MSELISSLGIDGASFIFQLVNFGIVLYVLHRFAYKPVLKMLEERTGKIEKGLADAEESNKKLAEASQKEKAVLVEARQHAKEIIEKSEIQARANRDEIIGTAKKESDRILEQAQKIAEEQKEQMVSEVKSEVAALVSVALEKVVDEKMDPQKDIAIINSAVNIK